MSDSSTASNHLIGEQLREIPGVRRSLAGVAFVLNLASATAYGARRCLIEESGTTRMTQSAFAGSDTQLREISFEMRAELDAILEAARHDVIEDGMRNSVTERLGDLVAKDFSVVVPALITEIEAGRTSPVIAAEVLKVLGRLQDSASHASRRWILEHSLSLASPFIRDGAGLGLARLADPAALPHLRRAIANEPDAQMKADLQLVIDELSETNVAPLAHRD